MRKNFCKVVLVVDSSGSMYSLRNDVIGSLNKFIEDQKGVEGECQVTHIQFSTDYRVIDDSVDVKDFRTLTAVDYNPNGRTALNDALANAIISTGAQLAAMKEEDRPDKVIVVVQTDGEENASKEYRDVSVIHEMVKEQQEKYSWEFVFLGTNIDAVKTAVDFGFNAKNAMFYDNSSLGATRGFGSVSVNICMYRSGMKSDMSYEQKDFEAQAEIIN